MTEDIPKQVDFSAVIEAWEQKVTLVKVAKTTDIPVGKMMYVEVEEKETFIANVAGMFYAVDNDEKTNWN
jgi:hypothetical protein